MSKFITVVTSHFVFIYCLAGYSCPSIWTLVKSTSSSTFTSYIAFKVSSTLSSTSKISSIVSLTSISILITITLTVFESVISLDIVKLSTSSTSIKSSSPSWRSYLWFPRFTRFTEVILLNLTCKAFMYWWILLTSAAVGLTTLFSICCPMENTH